MHTPLEQIRDNLKVLLTDYSQRDPILGYLAHYPGGQALAQALMQHAPDTMRAEKEAAQAALNEASVAQHHLPLILSALDWTSVAAIASGEIDLAALARELCAERRAKEHAAGQR